MGLVLRLEPRAVSIYMLILVPILAFMMAFLIGGFLLYWAGFDPLKGYSAFIEGSLLSPVGLVDTLVKMTPFLLMGTGIAFSNRANVLNVGAEGQYVVGAIVTTSVLIGLANSASVFATALALLLASISGALWGGLAGYLKSKYGVSEVITTVMMNWLAYKMLQWLLRGPLKDPKSEMWPMSPPIQATLGTLIPGTRLHGGFIIALAMAVATYYILFRTNIGFKVRTVGVNPQVAEYSGYNVGWIIVLSMLVSGGFAGLAGGIEVLGTYHILYEGISVGLGYTSIIVALVGKNHPLAVIPSSFMFGVLYNGAVYLQATLGVPYTLSKVIEGLVYLFVLVSEVFVTYRIRITRAPRWRD